MLTSEQINELHQLYWSEHWPIRKIERHLHMGWKTIKKYLDAPAQGAAKRARRSKLDPFKATIAEWLEKDPEITAALMQQRLGPPGLSRRAYPGARVRAEDSPAARPQTGLSPDGTAGWRTF
jgi:hypothetical protein